MEKKVFFALFVVLVVAGIAFAGGFQGDKIINHDSNGEVLLLTTPQSDFVGKTDTQTLTNKTISSPTVSGGTFSGSFTATNATVSGGTFTGAKLRSGTTTTGHGLCLNSSWVVSSCTTSLDDSGGCTCP